MADRVLVQVWSEFGRRAEENGSDGTDHGAAGLGNATDSGARPDGSASSPGLDPLDEDGNVRASSDFRGVYCGLLEQWFGHGRRLRSSPRRAASGDRRWCGDVPAPSLGASAWCWSCSVLRCGPGERRAGRPARLMVLGRRAHPRPVEAEHRARAGR